MSTFFSWQQAVRDASIEPTTKLICYTISVRMAGDGSGAYPSYATIAKESGLNRSTVIKHVKLAAAAGLLRIEGRLDDDGEQTSNLYIPTMPLVVQNNHPSLPGRLPLVAQDDPKNPHLTTQLSNPPSPKGEPDGFEEIWKAKWSRGPAQHIRQRALKAYAAAMKRGYKPADLLAAVKASAGVSKPGTEYAPMLSTWLNEERWKDAAGTVIISTAEVEASQQKAEEARRDYEERIKAAQDGKRREWGMIA